MDHSDDQSNNHDYIGDLPDISELTYADWAAFGQITSAESASAYKMESGDQSQQFDQRHMADEHAHGQLNRATEHYEAVDPQALPTTRAETQGETSDPASTFVDPMAFFNYYQYVNEHGSSGINNIQGRRGMAHGTSALEQAHALDTSVGGALAQAGSHFDGNMTAEDSTFKDSPNSASDNNLDYIPVFKSDDSPIAAARGELQFSTAAESQGNDSNKANMGPSSKHLLLPQGHAIQGQLSYSNTTMVASGGSGFSNHSLMGTQPSSQFFGAPVHINHNVNDFSASMHPTAVSAAPITPAFMLQGLPSANMTGQLGAPFQPQLSIAAPLQGGQSQADPTPEGEAPEEEIHLKFSSVEEANDYRPDREVPPPLDHTIPVTTGQKQAIVIQMLREMKSITHAQDNVGMIKPFREGKHSMERMEIVCWNILDACIVRHRVGPLLTPEEEKLKNKNPTVIRSFNERLEHMLDCLRTQKTICKHLLDPFYLFQFVDDPPFAKYRVTSNKSLNKKKSDFIIAGKKVLGHPKVIRRGKKSPNKNAAPLSTPFNTPKREPRAENESGATMGSAFVPTGASDVTQTPYAQLAEMHIRQGQAQPRQVTDTPASYNSTPMAASPYSTYPNAVFPNSQAYMGATPNTNSMRRAPLNRLYHLSGPQHSSPVIGTSEFPTPPASVPSGFARPVNSIENLPHRKRSSESAECSELQAAGQKKRRPT